MEQNNNPTWDKVNQWREELDILHAIIVKAQLTETVKWGAPVFTFKGKNIVGFAGFKNYFALWFYQGVFLKDDAKVLINAQEEVTKALRQWRFSSKEEINEELILSYIREAIENVNLGNEVKVTPKPKVIDALFQSVLDKDENLNQQFLKFSSAKQNEFMDFVFSAKRDVTKLNRIEKIKVLILTQKSLHEIYKK